MGVKSYLSSFVASLKDCVSCIKASREASQKTILVTGLPRSGTTWIGDILNAKVLNTSVFHEPFKDYSYLWNWQINEFPFQLSKVKTVYQHIESGNYLSRYQSKFNGPAGGRFLRFKWFHKFVMPRNRHIIIKDPCVFYGLDELKAVIPELYVVIIIRNPLSIVSSLKRLKWTADKRLELLFEVAGFKNQFRQIHAQFSSQLSELNVFEAQCLQTSIFFKILTDATADKVIRYEDMAASEENVYRFIADLGIYNGRREQLKNNIQYFMRNEASATEHHRHDTRRNSKEFVDVFKDRLDVEEIERCAEIFHQINDDSFYDLFQIAKSARKNITR